MTKIYLKKLTAIFIVIAFSMVQIFPMYPAKVYAQVEFNPVPTLPAPGTFVSTSPAYTPAIVAGITIYPENPLLFDFIIDVGDDHLQGEALRKESEKLISYFMATLTVPEEEMWVNLSPYERNRVVADGLGNTVMGRDMLAQDYMLKQLAASMMYPEDKLGNKFWQRVYGKAQEKFGTTEIPTNTFNKIWIIPEEAVIYVNGTSIFVADSHLKVMLEEDYMALEHHDKGLDADAEDLNLTEETKAILKDVLLPEIEREVNEGKNFATLRQIYHSMILATWYKNNLKKSLLGRVYVDQNKIKGIDVEDKDIKNKIYTQYIEAFKEGVYNYIREDYDPATKQIIPRRYFSGGLDMDDLTTTSSETKAVQQEHWLGQRSNSLMVKVKASSQLHRIDSTDADDSQKSNRTMANRGNVRGAIDLDEFTAMVAILDHGASFSLNKATIFGVFYEQMLQNGLPGEKESAENKSAIFIHKLTLLVNKLKNIFKEVKGLYGENFVITDVEKIKSLKKRYEEALREMQDFLTESKDQAAKILKDGKNEGGEKFLKLVLRRIEDYSAIQAILSHENDVDASNVELVQWLKEREWLIKGIHGNIPDDAVDVQSIDGKEHFATLQEPFIHIPIERIIENAAAQEGESKVRINITKVGMINIKVGDGREGFKKIIISNRGKIPNDLMEINPNLGIRKIFVNDHAKRIENFSKGGIGLLASYYLIKKAGGSIDVQNKNIDEKEWVEFVIEIPTIFSSKENDQASPKDYGGIDFNPNNLHLKEEGQAENINFTDFPNIQSYMVIGVTPVIIDIVPIVNFPQLLGLVDTETPVNSADADSQTTPFELSFVDKYRNKYIRGYEYEDVSA